MITYEIDTSKNLIRTKVNGEMNPSTLISHMSAVENDVRFMLGMNTFADLEDAFINLSYSEIAYITDLLKFREKMRGPCKWAVLVNSTTILNSIAMVVPEINLTKIKIKLFTDKVKAQQWLM